MVETTQHPPQGGEMGSKPLLSSDFFINNNNTNHSESNNLSSEESSRINKLGMLLVQLGAAKEENVFGAVDSETMKTFREGRVPDLLVINRREDDAERHPFVWYNPSTWFTHGAQVSPMLWDLTRQPIYILHPSAPDDGGSSGESGASEEDAPSSRITSESVEMAVAALTAEDSGTTARRKGRSGLPPVVMRPLTAEEVDALTPLVREDRAKMLASEEAIHKKLQGIEDTRYKYLVPAMEISCEKQVAQVVKCYQKQNAIADKKRAARMAEREAEVAKGFSNKVMDVSDIDVPLVVLDVLACGDAVKQLKLCTAEMVKGYSHGGLQ